VKRLAFNVLTKPAMSRGLAISRPLAPIRSMNMQQQVSAKMW
jgi:hypothetical protein